jgi:hypothetical protein
MKGRAWTVGMEKLGPGMYVDRDGALHISIPELCEHFGVPENAHNTAIVEQVAIEHFAEMGRRVPIEHRTHPDA